MIKIFYLSFLINLFYLSSCNIKSEEMGNSPIEYSGPQLEVNNLNTGRSVLAGAGSSTAALALVEAFLQKLRQKIGMELIGQRLMI